LGDRQREVVQGPAEAFQEQHASVLVTAKQPGAAVSAGETENGGLVAGGVKPRSTDGRL